MKKKGCWFLIPLLALALGGVSLGAETPTTKSAPSAATDTKSAPKKAKKTKPAAQKFRAKITAVNAKAGTLSAKNDVSEKNFVAQDAAKESLDRISIGDRVQIAYTEKEGKLYTSSVRRLKMKNANNTKSQKNAAPKSNKESTSSATPPAKDSSKPATK